MTCRLDGPSQCAATTGWSARRRGRLAARNGRSCRILSHAPLRGELAGTSGRSSSHTCSRRRRAAPRGACGTQRSGERRPRRLADSQVAVVLPRCSVPSANAQARHASEAEPPRGAPTSGRATCCHAAATWRIPQVLRDAQHPSRGCGERHAGSHALEWIAIGILTRPRALRNRRSRRSLPVSWRAPCVPTAKCRAASSTTLRVWTH